VIRVLGHLAFWPAFYSIGVLSVTMHLLHGSAPGWRAYLFVGLCGHACYLLDRVKASDARLDPADALAQPERYRFLAAHTRPIRWVIALDLLACLLIGWMITPYLLPIPLIAAACVLLYAGRPPEPRRPRIKDLPALKAILIAGAHTALAGATTLAFMGTHLAELDRGVLLLAIVWTIVFADAVLCDLDDQGADQAYATKSMPVLIGRSPAWALALLAHLGAGIALITLYHGSPGSIILACGLVLSDCLFTRMTHQRDAVDARLLPLVILFASLG